MVRGALYRLAVGLLLLVAGLVLGTCATAANPDAWRERTTLAGVYSLQWNLARLYVIEGESNPRRIGSVEMGQRDILRVPADRPFRIHVTLLASRDTWTSPLFVLSIDEALRCDIQNHLSLSACWTVAR